VGRPEENSKACPLLELLGLSSVELEYRLARERFFEPVEELSLEFDRVLERGIEFSSLTDAVEDPVRRSFSSRRYLSRSSRLRSWASSSAPVASFR
jgi:hypothetical protein